MVFVAAFVISISIASILVMGLVLASAWTCKKKGKKKY